MTLPRRTARLQIRECALAGLDDVARIFADPELALGGDEPLTREQSRAWLEEEIASAQRDGTGRCAVMLRETGEVGGGVGLVRRELEDGVAVELGYHLRCDQWGRGLATEAALACVAKARARPAASDPVHRARQRALGGGGAPRWVRAGGPRRVVRPPARPLGARARLSAASPDGRSSRLRSPARSARPRGSRCGSVRRRA